MMVIAPKGGVLTMMSVCAPMVRCTNGDECTNGEVVTMM